MHFFSFYSTLINRAAILNCDFWSVKVPLSDLEFWVKRRHLWWCRWKIGFPKYVSEATQQSTLIFSVWNNIWLHANTFDSCWDTEHCFCRLCSHRYLLFPIFFHIGVYCPGPVLQVSAEFFAVDSNFPLAETSVRIHGTKKLKAFPCIKWI